MCGCGGRSSVYFPRFCRRYVFLAHTWLVFVCPHRSICVTVTAPSLAFRSNSRFSGGATGSSALRGSRQLQGESDSNGAFLNDASARFRAVQYFDRVSLGTGHFLSRVRPIWAPCMHGPRWREGQPTVENEDKAISYTAKSGANNQLA